MLAPVLRGVQFIDLGATETESSSARFEKYYETNITNIATNSPKDTIRKSGVHCHAGDFSRHGLDQSPV
jgi:hypothetical protein